MHFDVRAVPEDQFTAWVNTTRQTGPSLDMGSYGELAKQSRHVTPYTYKDADPGIFAGIVSQKLPPGPGPDLHAGQEN
jgi:cytochrome o ubiquinol oxidase subunit 2